MRVLMISPAYPPDHCGVGDYAKHLVGHLANRSGLEVGVLTGSPSALSDNSRVGMFYGKNGVVRYPDVARAVRIFAPSVVHVQYPTMRGISPLVPPLVRYIARLPVIQTWHEHFSECGQLSWLNTLGVDGIIYVRPDAAEKQPRWLRRRLASVAVKYIPNGSTIPQVRLTAMERESVRRKVSDGRPIIAYFGFAYPNKGVELLFEIADPASHHLLLICNLDASHEYQKRLLDLANSEPWRTHVTVTGFLPAQDVGKYLAAADSVVFPFPGGIGNWNTSVKAALAAGTLVVGTTADTSRVGYDPEQNLYLARCDDITDLQRGLLTYLGRRVDPGPQIDWRQIAESHEEFYSAILYR